MRTIGVLVAFGLLEIALLVLSENRSAAEDSGSANCCARCGCNVPCQRVTKVACEVKEQPKTVFTVTCEDFSPPMPRWCLSLAACLCGKTEPPQVPPRCGPVRSKRTLVRKDVTEKVPVYSCQVIYLCDRCRPSADRQPVAHP